LFQFEKLIFLHEFKSGTLGICIRDPLHYEGFLSRFSKNLFFILSGFRFFCCRDRGWISQGQQECKLIS